MILGIGKVYKAKCTLPPSKRYITEFHDVSFKLCDQIKPACTCKWMSIIKKKTILVVNCFKLRF